MKEDLQSIIEEEKGVATCIFCGKTLQGHDVVLYRDWYAHRECTKESIGIQTADFDMLPFYAGSLSLIFGLLAATMLLTALSGIDLITGPRILIPGFVFMTSALLLQSIGFYGFTISFKDILGIGGAIVSILGAVLQATCAIILQTYGYDIAYYDPESGFLFLDAIPGFAIAYALAIGFVALTIALSGFILLFYDSVMGNQSIRRIVALILIIGSMFCILSPIGYLIEAIVVVALFLSVEMPRDWTRMSDL
ncbi:MAG: hypothetical protein ACFFED_01330 [Candidatus Thorarchaeota archaeon]